MKVQKQVVDKIKISLFVLIFFIALMFSDNKLNINHVSAQHISDAIRGIKDVKSMQIVLERDNGLFKNKQDFYARVVSDKDYEVDDIVFDRIVKTYKIGE
jgi:hypothetical protein